MILLERHNYRSSFFLQWLVTVAWGFLGNIGTHYSRTREKETNCRPMILMDLPKHTTISTTSTTTLHGVWSSCTVPWKQKQPHFGLTVSFFLFNVEGLLVFTPPLKRTDETGRERDIFSEDSPKISDLGGDSGRRKDFLFFVLKLCRYVQWFMCIIWPSTLATEYILGPFEWPVEILRIVVEKKEAVLYLADFQRHVLLL